MNNKILILLISFVISACSASGPKFERAEVLPESMATIYVYRPSMGFNAAGWPNIYLDGKKMFPLKNGGYGLINVTPGEHEIKAEGSFLLTNWYPPKASFIHNFEPRQEYFIRVTPMLKDTKVVGSEVAMSGSAQISLVPKSEAMLEIVDTNKVN